MKEYLNCSLAPARLELGTAQPQLVPCYLRNFSEPLNTGPTYKVLKIGSDNICFQKVFSCVWLIFNTYHLEAFICLLQAKNLGLFMIYTVWSKYLFLAIYAIFVGIWFNQNPACAKRLTFRLLVGVFISEDMAWLRF